MSQKQDSEGDGPKGERVAFPMERVRPRSKDVDTTYYAGVSPVFFLPKLARSIQTLTRFLHQTQTIDRAQFWSRITPVQMAQRQMVLNQLKFDMAAFTDLVTTYGEEHVEKQVRARLAVVNLHIKNLPELLSLSELPEAWRRELGPPEKAFFAAFSGAKDAIYEVAQQMGLKPIPELFRRKVPAAMARQPAAGHPSHASTASLPRPPAPSEPGTVIFPAFSAAAAPATVTAQALSAPGATSIAKRLTFDQLLQGLYRDLGRLRALPETLNQHVRAQGEPVPEVVMQAYIAAEHEQALRVASRLERLLTPDYAWPPDDRLIPLRSALTQAQDTIRGVIMQADATSRLGWSERDQKAILNARVSVEGTLNMRNASPDGPGARR
jgi:hypothetical protein